MNRNLYINPPIKEVVCSIRFDQTSSWDPAIPGIIYEKLKNDFPIRENGRDIETKLELSDDPNSFQPKVTFTERAIFKNEEENQIVQIGPNLLVINHIPPYTSWDEFQKAVDRAFDTYLSVAQPKGIERIELSYFNEISFSFINKQSVELEKFFNFYPFIGENLPQDYNSFITGITVPYDNGENIQRIQMTSAGSAVSLEIHYFSGNATGITYNDVFIWLDQAHNRIQTAFEGCIKDSLRHHFKEVERE